MPIPMHRLQVADRVLGSLAGFLLQPARLLRRRSTAGPDRQVLAIKFWGLGSLQLLTPAITALRSHHPDTRLVLLTLQDNVEFAEGLGVFDEVIGLSLGTKSWLRLAARLLGITGVVRRRRFDAVYDFEFFTRFSAVVSLLSRSPQTLGFSAPGISRGGFHTHLIPFQRGWHVARNFRALAGGEDGQAITPDDLIPFPVSASKGLEATTALIEAGAWGGRALVVLNPNAGELSLERRWPLENFASLARQLIQVDGVRIVLVGSKGERERVGNLQRMIGEVPEGSCVDLSGRLSIGALVALLRQADVFVSNDSGPMHVAAAQGVATLGLFGPETPELYHPIGQRARFLYRPTVCSPCINVHNNKLSTCVMGRAECMTNLSVGYVLAATRDEIGRHGERTAAEATLPKA